VAPIALAYASCQAWDSGFFTAYRDMAAQDLDLILHLGDYIYENAINATGGNRKLKTPLSSAHNAVTKTLSQYRLRHSLANADPDLQAARAAAPWIVSLDDHDVEDNWAADSSPTGMSSENFLRRRAAAFRAYFENLPLRPSSLPSGPDLPGYRVVPYGRMAQFYVLDERQFRSKLDIAARDDPSRSILGMPQEHWLLDRLGRSPSTWNVLANQVMMFQLDRLTDPGLQQLNPDTWDGYAASRDRILHGIAERRVANPIVITGDAHVNCAADLKADFGDPGSATIASEFLGTSVTSGNDGYDTSAGGQEWLAANPHLKFFNGQRGYVRANITREAWHTDYVVMSKVTVPDGTASIRRSFVVEAGRTGLQDA
jgi:alkaline phosphatase D